MPVKIKIIYLSASYNIFSTDPRSSLYRGRGQEGWSCMSLCPCNPRRTTTASKYEKALLQALAELVYRFNSGTRALVSPSGNISLLEILLEIIAVYRFIHITCNIFCRAINFQYILQAVSGRNFA